MSDQKQQRLPLQNEAAKNTCGHCHYFRPDTQLPRDMGRCVKFRNMSAKHIVRLCFTKKINTTGESA